MKKKILKIFVIIGIILAIVFINMPVFADTGSGLVNYFDGKNGVGDNATQINTGEGETLIEKVIGPILSVIRIIAISLSIIVLTYLGIKYMSAAPQEKANIKNQLITFTIGAMLVVGTASVLKIVQETVTSISNPVISGESSTGKGGT